MCGWCVDINICKSQGLDSVRSKRKMSLVDVMSEEQCSTDHVKVCVFSNYSDSDLCISLI